MAKKVEIKRCGRRDCQFFGKAKDNNCGALSTVYDNDMQCTFYKKKTSNS